MDKEKLEFKEFSTSKPEKSSVWGSFLRSTNGTFAQCKKCKKILKCQNTTTCLHNHLKLHRTENDFAAPGTSSEGLQASQPQTRTLEIQSKKRKATIDQYFSSVEDKLEDLVAKMTACDGLSFRVFCSSDSIKKLFKKGGYENLPNSPNTIKKIVITKSEKLKDELKKEQEVLKEKGLKFSVSLDEWTSARNRRYMNVNIHSPNFKNKPFKNLGLSKIVGRGTSENCIKILEQKLKRFDLSLDTDIACAVTDGASVMCSMGKKIPVYHQQCIAHGIQCAVVDVLYKKREYSESRETYEVEELTESDIENSDEEEGFAINQRSHSNGNRRPCLIYYGDLIEKVRNVVKIFKRSPTKSEVFKNYQASNKKLELILDCKTRWSSMVDMITRFLLLKDPAMKALIDLKNDITFSTAELSLLEEFSSSLNIIKATVESLCRETANLLTAEVALKFMIAKLEEKNTFISRRLSEDLKARIIERRQANLVNTLKYLHNPTKYYEEPASDVFLSVDNNDIVKVIVEISAKYFCKIQESDNDDDIILADLQRQRGQTDSTQADEPTGSLKEQLQKSIDSTLSTAPSSFSENVSTFTTEDLETSIRMQMALYDRGGPRQAHLNQVYDFLICIPPTSVECERVFSSTKYINNHLRTSLNDDSVDAISFLRSYYRG